jgi:hypothetical protein
MTQRHGAVARTIPGKTHPFCSQSPKRVGSAPRREPFGPPTSPVSGFVHPISPSSSSCARARKAAAGVRRARTSIAAQRRCERRNLHGVPLTSEGAQAPPRETQVNAYAHCGQHGGRAPHLVHNRHVRELVNRLLLLLSQHNRRASNSRPASAAASNWRAKRRICRGAGFISWVDHGGARGQAAQHPVRYRAAAGKVLRAPQRRRDRRGRGHRLQQYHLACARASEPCLAEGARGPYRSDRHPLHCRLYVL